MDDEEEIDLYEGNNSNNKKSYEFYSNNYSKSNSSIKKNVETKDAKTIKFKKNEPIDAIEDNYDLEEYDEANNIDFGEYSLIKNENKEESFEADSSIYYFKKEVNLSLLIDKFKFLIKKFRKKYTEEERKSIIKCPLSYKDNSECNYIPIITKRKYNICFYCNNHKNEKYLELNTYSFFENINKYFMKGPRKFDINKDDSVEIIKFMQDNLVKFKLSVHELSQNSGTCITKQKGIIKEIIKDFKNFLMIYNNKKDYDESFRVQSMKKIESTYFRFLEKFNLLIYFIFMKRLINEFHNSKDLDIKNKIIILKNFAYATSFTEEMITKPIKKYYNWAYNKNKKEKKEVIKFYWIIEFYSENEKKYNDNKNKFIAVNEKGIIAIFSLNFSRNNNQIFSEEIMSPYELIATKEIQDFKPIKITKFEKFFNQKENDNFFLINSKNCTEIKAIIINVKENYNVDIKQRYTIEIIQTIKELLFSSIEYNFKGKNYLINFNEGFDLWELNQEKNQIEKKILENKIIDNDKYYNYGPLIYVENESKKLFIIQCFSPNSTIEFYEFIEENDKFNFIKLDKNIKFNEDQSVLKSNNNYFIYKNKYLFLTSGKNRNHSYSGIYIIDLEKYEIVDFQSFPKYQSIYCIIPIKNKNNAFISSSIFCRYNKKGDDKINNNITRGRLIFVEISEKDDKIALTISKYSEGGDFYFINCNKLFNDEYFFTSTYENNILIKYNKTFNKFSQIFKMTNKIKNN